MKFEIITVTLYGDDEHDVFIAESKEPPMSFEGNTATIALVGLMTKVRKAFDETAGEITEGA